MGVQLDGWWISFSGDEQERVCAVLRDSGYEESPSGLKKMLLELEADDEPPPIHSGSVAGMVTEWMMHHPDKVRHGIDVVRSAVKKMQKGRGYQAATR